MMSNQISVILYSYKNKNLKNIVETLIKNSSKKLFIHIIDQNPVLRGNQFSTIDDLSYQHVKWDIQRGEAFYRHFGLTKAVGEYSLILSDDILVSPGWDKELIDFIKNKNAIVSGAGKKTIFQKDKFSISFTDEHSDGFTMSKYVDRNFIFGKTETLVSVGYPNSVKYFGQQEILSLDLFCHGINVFSGPSWIYSDIHNRTVEALYCPFSLDHNYNSFIDRIKGNAEGVLAEQSDAVLNFLRFHSIESGKLYRLPFENNDVEYNPDKLNINSVDGRRFTGGLNEIS